MATHHDQDLAALKDRLLTMASIAERSVRLAVEALVERDDDKARTVIQEDSRIDDLEMEIDEMSINLLARAPLATDLRLITMAMKFSRDLERVGDEATTISRRAVELGQEPQLKPYVDIPKMAATALDMLGDAMNAFVQRDPAKARQIVPRDKEVDALNKQLQRELSSYMIEKPSTITRCLHLMTISKSLERIADHAANIAEEVVYLHEGKDIRHKKAGETGAAPGQS
ncbi:MAG TPA: phosphate transport system regulatory protein PhoU [Verrucomicrobiales bacterium]|nr:phosphate transport system regulatory protein PhoU [Verrucomicrobiales bacterium]